MRRLLLCLLCAGLTPAADDWKPLFNGKDLDGWTVADAQGRPGFTVENGQIRTQSGRGMLWYSRQKIGNATLRVVYKMTDDHGNSGIFIRIPSEPPNEGFAIHNGIEVQIDDRDDDWHCTGVLYSMTKAKARPSRPAGEWNTEEISCDGPRITVTMNGEKVIDMRTDDPALNVSLENTFKPELRQKRGFIGLQNHHTGVRFRNIRIHVLPDSHKAP